MSSHTPPYDPPNKKRVSLALDTLRNLILAYNQPRHRAAFLALLWSQGLSPPDLLSDLEMLTTKSLCPTTTTDEPLPILLSKINRPGRPGRDAKPGIPNKPGPRKRPLTHRKPSTPP